MRILFSSFHNYLDPTSGAAVSTRATLQCLAKNGCEVRVLCGEFFDSSTFNEESFLETFRRQGTITQIQECSVKLDGARLVYDLISFDDAGVRGTAVFDKSKTKRNSPQGFLTKAAGKIFLKFFVNELTDFKPDVYVTYGGYWVAPYAAQAAKSRGAENIFMLHNLAYSRKELFSFFDKIIVPSEFAKLRYRERLGIETLVFPPLVDEECVLAKVRNPKYVTFINPSPEKGLYFFLGIAKALKERRPDIPVLVVESRAKFDSIRAIPEAKRLTNLFYAKTVSRPADIYEQTKILLMPSLCEETFGRVALEASLNGIPTLCSNRGALLELLGASGLTFEIPARFTPRSREIPTEAEVAPWVEAIVSLWDDGSTMEDVRLKLKDVVQRYSSLRVSRNTLELFSPKVWSERSSDQ